MKNLLKLFLISLFCFKAEASYIIRDSETEAYVRELLDEILVIAKIEPKNINLYIVKDDNINAFVYGGPNIFINTGLIQSSENYQILQAVIAHEVGHLKGLHIIKFSSNVNKVITEALFYSVSGALIALTGGAGAIGALLGVTAGMNVAEKSILKYSRNQESEADYFAAQTLKTLQSSGLGAIVLFNKFEKMQEKVVESSKIDVYLQTHPLAKERKDFMQSYFSNLTYKPYFNDNLEKKHIFVKAKLAGFFNNINMLFLDDFKKNELANTYFQAFRAFNLQDFQEAEKLINKLLNYAPNNPFFVEFLADIYAKQAKYSDSIKMYTKALKIKNKDFNFLFSLAEVYSLQKDYKTAILKMNEASIIEPQNPLPSYKLANYYSAINKNYEAKIYFLESEFLKQDYTKAKILLSNLNQDLQQNNPKLEPFFIKKLEDISYILKTK